MCHGRPHQRIQALVATGAFLVAACLALAGAPTDARPAPLEPSSSNQTKASGEKAHRYRKPKSDRVRKGKRHGGAKRSSRPVGSKPPTSKARLPGAPNDSLEKRQAPTVQAAQDEDCSDDTEFPDGKITTSVSGPYGDEYTAGQTITWDASGMYDPDDPSSSLTYKWELGYLNNEDPDHFYQLATGSDAAFSYTFRYYGDYLLYHWITDKCNQTAQGEDYFTIGCNADYDYKHGCKEVSGGCAEDFPDEEGSSESAYRSSSVETAGTGDGNQCDQPPECGLLETAFNKAPYGVISATPPSPGYLQPPKGDLEVVFDGINSYDNDKDADNPGVNGKGIFAWEWYISRQPNHRIVIDEATAPWQVLNNPAEYAHYGPSQSPTVNHSFSREGTYAVYLFVYDKCGKKSTLFGIFLPGTGPTAGIMQYEVEAQKQCSNPQPIPTPTVTFDPPTNSGSLPEHGVGGLKVTATVHASSPNGEMVSRTLWIAAGKNVLPAGKSWYQMDLVPGFSWTVTLPEPGTYSFGVQVWDECGVQGDAYGKDNPYVVNKE